MTPLQALIHDVGKYIARTARNLPSGPIPSVLADMLCKDLYQLDGSQRASKVFAQRRKEVSPDAVLDLVAADLDRIDELESAIRRGDESAMREAAGLALNIEERLRGLSP